MSDMNLEARRRDNGEFGEKPNSAPESTLSSAPVETVAGIAKNLRNVNERQWQAAWEASSSETSGWRAAANRVASISRASEMSTEVDTATAVLDVAARAAGKRAYQSALRESWGAGDPALRRSHSKAEELELAGKAVILSGPAAQAIMLRDHVSVDDYMTLTAPLRSVNAID